jgi:hypothetical protein
LSVKTDSENAILLQAFAFHYCIFGIRFNGQEYPFNAFYSVPKECKMPFAEVKAAPYGGAFIYFANGNELWAYMNANLALPDKERVLFSFPQDETIAYMTNLYSSGRYNYLVVLTNNATDWKLHVYEVKSLTAPEVNFAEPVFFYSGEGHGRYVMYRTAGMPVA